jgi:hypothetical protein
MMTVIANLEALNAEALLRIEIDAPERLFPRDAKGINQNYRLLVKKWHPDVNKDVYAGAVIDHLTKLKAKAEEKLVNGTWQEPGVFTCRLKSGKEFKVSSDVRRDIDIGTLHISQNTATYVVKHEYADMFHNAVGAIGALNFADNKMKDAFISRLPVTFKTYEAEYALILTIKKKPDDILLRDLLPFLNKDNHDRHVAWIVGRMLGMARYLDYAGITHNAITMDTLFANPAEHSIALFGGWWYAKPVGQILTYVPTEAVDFIPDDDGHALRATQKVDLEMVKAAGRELLGDRGGTSFLKTKPAPDAMLSYLRDPSTGNPQEDLERWDRHVLPDSFGPRKFINLPVTYNDVYQPGG